MNEWNDYLLQISDCLHTNASYVDKYMILKCI